MRILYLSPRQSWPPNSGAKLRDYHLARVLGNQSDLTYVFYVEPGTVPPSLQDLPFCRKVVAVETSRGYTPAKLISGLFGRWSFPVRNYTSQPVVEAIRTCLREHKYDLVHVDSIHLAACMEILGPELKGIPCFYNWHNIESELMQRYSEGAGHSFARKTYASITSRRLRRDEDRILRSAQGHVVCSQREQDLIALRAPLARVAVIENGVDAEAYSPGASGSIRDRLVFVGSMSYHANSDAALWFTHEIWPGIHQRFPHWRLTLVGSGPGEAVRKLGELPGVEVTGTVPLVQPYYHEAVAAIVPLRIGGGTRLKILEAMAAGVPVVSSSLGAEGIPVTQGRDILLADRPEQWLSALESLQQVETARSLCQHGRDLVESRYDWNAIGNRLMTTYREWSAS